MGFIKKIERKSGSCKRMAMYSNQHLFIPPLYSSSDGIWRKDFLDSLSSEKVPLHWDLSAILSMISFGYACGNRTLIKEVKRQPWLSTIHKDHTVTLEDVPPHDFYWDNPKNIAAKLRKLLEDEAQAVCQDKTEIYVLLSGGLDSRIVAGILSDMYLNGKLPVKPKSITWGIENSRDVAYADVVAQTLGIENISIGLSIDDIKENLFAATELLGNLVSPYHLHKMLWCKHLGEHALVINGSYGDSVGRGEYSKRHLLELDYLSPKDQYQLINPALLETATEELRADLESIRKRVPDKPKYAQCEVTLQSQYMRGLIAHAMSVIDHFCTFYSMFTAPEVYQFMWRIHPSARNNHVYAYLLDDLNPRLAHIPWARSNKPLKGNPIGFQPDLRQKFHRYEDWITQLLTDDIFDLFDPQWFHQTGIFNRAGIENLRSAAIQKAPGFRYDIVLWLCSFRILSDRLQGMGKEPQLDTCSITDQPGITPDVYPGSLFNLRLRLRENRILAAIIPKFRKFLTKVKALFIYPPKSMKRGDD